MGSAPKFRRQPSRGHYATGPRRWVCTWTLLLVFSVGQMAVVVAHAKAPQFTSGTTGEPPADDVPRRSGQSEPAPTVNREVLEQSLGLGREFLLKSQLADGTFRYKVNCLTGEVAAEQDAVRQAGALWGLSLIHRDHPSPDTRSAVLRGLAFYTRNSHLSADGCRFVRFPGAAEGESGTVALVALALIEFLRAEPRGHEDLRRQLDEYVAFLVSLQRADRRFYKNYQLSSGIGLGLPSPYFDGEILLALVKAARYLNHDELRSRVVPAASAMHAAYVANPVKYGIDDSRTKGFFQWGCLAYSELSASGWPGTEPYAGRTIALAHWMIDVHKTLDKRGNTAYAHEGLIVAFQAAHESGDDKSRDAIRTAIERGLGKLVTWQVGGPRPNGYLREHAPAFASCRGGILNSAENPWLRIDTTQHQMHAIVLALRYVWPAED